MVIPQKTVSGFTFDTLLEMLKLWPREARPRTTVGHIDDAVDLACMSGLRWRRQQTGTRDVSLHPTFGGFDPERVTVVSDGLDANSDTVQFFTGPTLLHAIDAAIRATQT